MKFRRRSRYRSAPSEPKPFIYISTELPEKDEYVPHDRFSNLTGQLSLNIEVLSDYLFVGSGFYDFREKGKLVYYSFFRTSGGIAIPGSSIKGAVRSVAEAISNSCVSQIAGITKYGGKVIKKDEKTYLSKAHQKCKFDPDKGIEELCPVCRIFGTTGYGGRIGFSDAILSNNFETRIEKIRDLFPPRTQSIIKNKRKFYQNKRFNPIGNLIPEKNYRFVESVKKGSIFKTILNFQNLSKDELSLLFYAMGINQDYMIKIGGAKPRCFGTVKFQPTEIKILNQEKLLNPREMMEIKDISWIEETMKSDGLINPSLFQRFKEAMKPVVDVACPKVNY